MFLKEFFLKLLTHLFLKEKISKKRFFSGKIIILDDYISNQIIVHDIYEKKECEFIKKYILKEKFKKKIFVDIGANIGNHSVFFSKHFKKVLSFEPNQRLFKILNYNTYEYKNINIYNIGLSNYNESKYLYFCSSNFGGGTLIKKNLINCKTKIIKSKVKLKNLDSVIYANDSKKIALIKIDAEGFEQNIIKGMKNILLRSSPILLVEINNNHFQSNNLINILKKNDYVYFYEMVSSFGILCKFLSTPLKLKKLSKFEKKYYSLIVCSKVDIVN